MTKPFNQKNANYREQLPVINEDSESEKSQVSEGMEEVNWDNLSDGSNSSDELSKNFKTIEIERRLKSDEARKGAQTNSRKMFGSMIVESTIGGKRQSEKEKTNPNNSTKQKISMFVDGHIPPEPSTAIKRGRSGSEGSENGNEDVTKLDPSSSSRGV